MTLHRGETDLEMHVHRDKSPSPTQKRYRVEDMSPRSESESPAPQSEMCFMPQIVALALSEANLKYVEGYAVYIEKWKEAVLECVRQNREELQSKACQMAKEHTM